LSSQKKTRGFAKFEQNVGCSESLGGVWGHWTRTVWTRKKVRPSATDVGGRL